VANERARNMTNRTGTGELQTNDAQSKNSMRDDDYQKSEETRDELDTGTN